METKKVGVDADFQLFIWFELSGAIPALLLSINRGTSSAETSSSVHHHQVSRLLLSLLL